MLLNPWLHPHLTSSVAIFVSVVIATATLSTLSFLFLIDVVIVTVVFVSDVVAVSLLMLLFFFLLYFVVVIVILVVIKAKLEDQMHLWGSIKNLWRLTSEDWDALRRFEKCRPSTQPGTLMTSEEVGKPVMVGVDFVSRTKKSTVYGLTRICVFLCRKKKNKCLIKNWPGIELKISNKRIWAN